MRAHLVRSSDRPASSDGVRVGLAGVLDDLNRVARPSRVPGWAVGGFRWDEEDEHTERWWPQGVAASAIDRPVLLTTAYAKDAKGKNAGTRLTFVDLATLRYRHVRLVQPASAGASGLKPVRVHAGGVVWDGPWVHVAATARGLCSFHVDDICRVEGQGYVLPLRFSYDSAGEDPLTFSFMSLDSTSTGRRLVMGEYLNGHDRTRLATFGMDGTTGLLAEEEGVVRPLEVWDTGVPRMQGVTVVDGEWFVVTSNGRFRRGSLWTGTPEALREHRCALPIGPEDLAYWPTSDQLWTLTEHPGRRYVAALDRASLWPLPKPRPRWRFCTPKPG